MCPAVGSPPTAADGRRLRVLVVEDEAGLAEALVAAFDFRGWDAESAVTIDQATKTVQLRAPDLVVLDVMLPDGSGFDLLTTLRARNPQLAVLFLTARDAPQDRVHGIELGGDDYITKPFDLSEVLARSQGLMRRAGLLRQQQGNQLQVADLLIDVDGHEARRAGELITLTATEFALLRYLAGHQRRVLSKEELLRKVWGSDFDGTSHVVELYVSYLRKKVDAGREPLIHTVRGAGYVMRPPLT
ncbi:MULTISPECIES: response regulator transcription factor [Allobranchiibius]|uniref:Two-component system OmpR family response regulator n=1 Tax=Allobranchiibius huperziae TaxID=1874116 RepID=A0A853DFT6_9MICO|nr:MULTISPECIES: response regulator transcription factor [Allobranchiibius]MBO1768351.1 response regulator transcription factor [Allobranchiibius sp. GilTou38]NYJ76396.1 two-component system OmpR family response regulator [Allobranchiibius huperziae]UIJ35497.1 response regulator transcription factor [Allobranchiibius sp. GilTou73]